MGLCLAMAACSGTDGPAEDGEAGGGASSDAPDDPATDATGQADTDGPSDDAGDGPAPGACPAAAVGEGCDDGDCCTQGDSCQACDATDDPACSSEGMKCVGNPACFDEDENVCTLTQCSCDPDGAPVCADEDTPNGAPCDFDPNDCTLGDECLAGECIKSQPLPLDDGNPCTDDTCVKGDLVHTSLLEGQCDDGNECTTGDTCVTGTCTGGDTVACVVSPCMADAECVPGEGCVESPLPTGAFCGTDNACVVSAACDAEQSCEVVAYTNCDDGNLCTADSCDPATGCANEAPALEGDACTLDTEATCVADGVCTSGDCVAVPILSCVDGDECCAEGCDATSDSDCSASCGNGILEGTEQCDGDCPTSCEGADGCQYGVLVGSADACSAQCSFIQITQLIQGDGCCPAGASNLDDSDCEPLCGNGVIDEGELCDGLCPTSCQGDGACGTPELVGSSDGCDAECIDPITSCVNGDGCCADGCTVATDDDCAPVQPCHIYIEIECVDDPVWPVRYKVSVNATVGVMNYYWSPTSVETPDAATLVQGGFCWNSTGEDFLAFGEPVGCFNVVYDTITENSDCSNNGPASSCQLELCYDCQ